MVARFSEDAVTIAFSTDGGSTFTPSTVIPFSSALDTLEDRSYFYGIGGPSPTSASLFVHSLDLSDFGFAPGDGINAIRVSGVEGGQLDLIRVAGFDRESEAVPEPATLMLLGVGLSWAAVVRRLRATRPLSVARHRRGRP